MFRITLISGKEVASLPLAELSDVKALKQRLHQQNGLPPRFRQKLLHEGTVLDDAVKLASVMELQVLAATSPDAVAREPRQLAAAEHPSVAEAEGALKRRLLYGPEQLPILFWGFLAITSV